MILRARSGKGRVYAEGKHVLRKRLREIPPEFAKVVKTVPPRSEPYLPPHWLHTEMLERYRVLSHAGLLRGMYVLEIGSGAQAITTVPLAYMVGREGRVVAVEIERWHNFQEIVNSTGLENMIPLACDATNLPIPYECFDLCVTVHSVRSMRSEDNMIRIIKGGLRISPRIFLAESLPLAKTESQRAHQEMYNLREEIFEAALGAKDDIRYLPVHKLLDVVGKADGSVADWKILDTHLPHYLAFLPREYVERIQDPGKRGNLLERWDLAMKRLTLFGEEQLPVAVLNVVRIEE